MARLSTLAWGPAASLTQWPGQAWIELTLASLSPVQITTHTVTLSCLCISQSVLNVDKTFATGAVSVYCLIKQVPALRLEQASAKVVQQLL